MRELAVFYCTRCGYYAYYQTSRHPQCPKCLAPEAMSMARMHYMEFMQMSYRERDEYLSMKEHYQSEYLKAKERYDALKGEAQDLLHCGPANPMFEACRPFYHAKMLTEDLIQALIARITVYDNDRLDIELVYQDEFLKVASFLEGVTA